MELDRDVLRSAYLKYALSSTSGSVHWETNENPRSSTAESVPSWQSSREPLQSSPPTFSKLAANSDDNMSVKASKARLQPCANRSVMKEAASGFSVSINQLENIHNGTSDNQITYTMYKDPDSPDELIIDLDRDGDTASENGSDFGVIEKDINYVPIGEFEKPSNQTKSQSRISDLEINRESQGNSHRWPSNSNSRELLTDDGGYFTSDEHLFRRKDLGFNKRMTDGLIEQNPHRHAHLRGASSIPLRPTTYDFAHLPLVNRNINCINHLQASIITKPHCRLNRSSISEMDYCTLPTFQFPAEMRSDVEHSSYLRGHYRSPVDGETSWKGADKPRRMVSWHIPENEIRQKSKTNGPLASLYRYCENTSSSDPGSYVQSLKERFAVSIRYPRFQESAPTSTKKSRLHGQRGMPVNATKYPHNYNTQTHYVGNGSLQNQSSFPSSYYHCTGQQQILTGSSSVESSGPDVPDIKNDPWQSNRSRLFGGNIFQKPYSSSIKPSHDTVDDKENHPRGSSTVVAQEVSDDSGIEFPSSDRETEPQDDGGNANQERDVELELSSETATRPPSKPILNHSLLFHPRDELSSLYPTTNDNSADVVGVLDSRVFSNRRRYILDTQHTSQQSTPAEQTAHVEYGLPSTEQHGSPSPSPVTYTSEGQCDTVLQAKPDVSDPPEDNLSDFRALVNAFDKSPVKATSKASEAAAEFALSGALVGSNVNSSKYKKRVTVQPKTLKAVSKTYKCEFCERSNMCLRAINRHKLKIYYCSLCNKQFCLLELMLKHRKMCVFQLTSHQTTL